jgi:hypothetical protein
MSPTFPRDDRPHLRPGPSEPGTLLEQLRAMAIYFALPDRIRERYDDQGWQRARRAAVPHAREVKP